MKITNIWNHHHLYSNPPKKDMWTKNYSKVQAVVASGIRVLEKHQFSFEPTSPHNGALNFTTSKPFEPRIYPKPSIQETCSCPPTWEKTHTDFGPTKLQTAPPQNSEFLIQHKNHQLKKSHSRVEILVKVWGGIRKFIALTNNPSFLRKLRTCPRNHKMQNTKGFPS